MQDKVFTLVHCRTNDHISDIFMNPLSKVKFIKFCTFLELQEDEIMGGCTNVI